MQFNNYPQVKQFFYEHKRLSELYVVLSIRGLAIAMIALFLPIYVYLLRNSIFDVLEFYFWIYLSVMVLFPIADYIASKIGNAHMDLLSAPFGIAFYLLIYFFNPLVVGLPLLGILYGFFEAFFWAFFHGEFSFVSDEKLVENEVSVWRAVHLAVGLLGPFVGGIIITVFGFHVLFMVVVGLLLVSPLPLLLSVETKINSQMNLKEIFSKKYLRIAPAYIGDGAAGVATTIVWPLFVYFLIPDFLYLGSMSLIINIVSIVVVLVVGAKVVYWGKHRLIKIGGIIFAFSVAFRGLSTSILTALGSWSIGAFSYPIVSVPMESIVYSRAKKENMMELFTFREWMLSLGRFIAIFAVAFFITNFPLHDALQYVFIFSGCVTLLMVTMK